MGVTVNVTHSADISELIVRNKEVAFMRNVEVPS